MSLSKLEKSIDVLNVMQCEDRITNLPKCLVTDILSRLPTKDAVATSVLSTKWKLSWTCITKLDFDDSKLYIYTGDCRTRKLKNFTSFVTRVLLLRDRSYLQNMQMMFSLDSHDDSLVNAWLDAASHCNIQELNFYILSKPGLLPSDIFLCRTLVVLKLLSNGSYVNLPISFWLPSLKILHLSGVHFANEVSLTSLLSSCPLLEELKLCGCTLGKNVRVANIIALALKRLIISSFPYNLKEDHRIVINTPSLEYFKLSDRVAQVNVTYMDHLMEAHIDSDSGVRVNNTDEAITNLLNGISHIKKLIVSYESIKVTSTSDPTIPKFLNLTFLEVHTPLDDSGWEGLAMLVENSPCLKTLYIKQAGYYIPEKHGSFTIPFHDVPSCFLLHLKEIKINPFHSFEDEKKLVEYILKNAKVLETLTLCNIIHGVVFDTDFVMVLRSFPRASNICKVVIE